MFYFKCFVTAEWAGYSGLPLSRASASEGPSFTSGRVWRVFPVSFALFICAIFSDTYLHHYRLACSFFFYEVSELFFKKSKSLQSKQDQIFFVCVCYIHTTFSLFTLIIQCIIQYIKAKQLHAVATGAVLH